MFSNKRTRVRSAATAPSSIITKHLTSVWSMACFCFSAAHCPRIHQLNITLRKRIIYTSLFWLLSGLSVAGRGLSIFIHLRLRGKTCFGFSTQNYVRFWYYCEIRCRRGIKWFSLVARSRPSDSQFSAAGAEPPESIPPIFSNYSPPAYIEISRNLITRFYCLCFMLCCVGGYEYRS